MQDTGKKRWLIKDKDGHVRGPFYTDDMLARIARGEITGEEKISLYPSTKWIPISNELQFYDQLLASLDEDGANITEETNAHFDFTPPKKINRAENVSANYQTQSSQTQSSPKTETPKKVDRQKKNSLPIIELQKLSQVVGRARLKKLPVPLVLVVWAILAVVFYLPTGPNLQSDRVHLRAPQAGKPMMAKEQIREKTQNALKYFVQDNYSGYLNAEHELVQVLEGDPRNAGAISLTCLTYLELWPYAAQDSADFFAISKVTQLASRIDPAGVDAGTCRTVELLVRGRFVEAKGVVEMVLDTFGREGNPPIAFYYFKARLFDEAKDYTAGLSYVQSAQGLWSQWLRLYTLEAEMLTKMSKYNEAANKYRSILKINPKHIVAQIELGIIEHKFLQNYQQGQKILELAMQIKEKAPPLVFAKGYLHLSEIALQQKNKSAALGYAQKAYALNSANARIKEIILQIGGEKKLKETKINDSQIVYEGDQLVREGDCGAAQAHYKTAYELNEKNGVAAMKAAECLWELSLSSEAIKWLDNAIRADPKLTDAYVLLADYYSQRFNFVAAARILSKGATQNPKNYKVLRGLAMIELRRNNFSGAINYALKAVELYEADVESHVILARARLGTNEQAKAIEAASKAIEIDMNNRAAQAVYAEALAATQGIHVGIDYILRLVNTYPTITEYRLALGQLYLKDQNYSKAQQLFEQVIKIEDKPKVAYVFLGKTYHLQNLREEARTAYFKAASLDPSDVEPLFLVGQLYFESKQFSEAREQFRRVIRIIPEYPLVNYYMGRAALYMGSTSEALEQAKIEKAKNPNLADPYLLAAEAYTEMKQYSACSGEYQQAVKLRTVNSDIYVKMARCYRLSGNLDAATSMVNEAARQESGNPEVWKEQGALFEMRQEAIKAIEAYNQYLVLAPNAPDREQIQMRINTLSQ